VRKVKDGEITKDLYGFLATEPNAEVGAIHPKAMPVILRTADAVDRWMTAPAEDVPALKQPLPDGSLRIVARGTKEDGPPTGPNLRPFVSQRYWRVLQMRLQLGVRKAMG
jgi:putative SOS response-associated peptidase YedK